jgi:predicted MFS family arabinose efflux permease
VLRPRHSVLSMITTPAIAPATGCPRPLSRPRLLSRALLLRFVSIVGASASFYLMLSVVPLYARSAGASTNLAGLTTTALSLSTIAGYLPTPRLVARYGHRPVLAAGLLLLGAPTLVLAGSGNVNVIMAVCVVRGIGFALTCVSGGALTASLIPAERRGEGLALVGVVSGIPSVAALPLGVWFASHVGYRPVFVAAAVAALLPLASVPGLPAAAQRTRTARADRDGGMLAGLRTPAVVKPAIIFAATTMAAGIFVTFLPLAATHASANVAALALLCQPAASIGGRWLAGRHGDRHGTAGHRTAGLLVPGVLITAAGVAALSLSSVPAAVLVGASLFGVGFGITQNTTLTQMYGRVPESGYSMVSAVWNLAYDAGMGIGAAGFGLLAAHTGYPAAFVLTAIMLPIPLLLVGIPDGLLRHP